MPKNPAKFPKSPAKLVFKIKKNKIPAKYFLKPYLKWRNSQSTFQ